MLHESDEERAAMDALFAEAHAATVAHRRERIRVDPPARDWIDIDAMPRDGTLIDVLFDPASTTPHLAEIYAPGCTLAVNPIEPAVWNTAWAIDHLAEVSDLVTAAHAADGGGHTPLGTYGYVGIPFTHWRPAAHPPRA